LRDYPGNPLGILIMQHSDWLVLENWRQSTGYQEGIHKGSNSGGYHLGIKLFTGILASYGITRERRTSRKPPMQNLFSK